MGKVLFCATVDSHISAFHLSVLQWFKQLGWEVHVAASGKTDIPFVDQKYNIPIQRSPLHLNNISAYHSLRSILKENKYDLIHCHTPMGGVLARVSARKAREKGTKVIYTAHGFHFYKGAPLLNWLIYYPVEKMLSSFTDCLITINEEDYYLAQKHKFSSMKIEHVHGVGIDTNKYKPVSNTEKQKLREQFNYGTNDFLMFYAAEFNKNKNHKLLIHSVAAVKEQIPHVKLLLAGSGPLVNECKKLTINLGITENVQFLGYRNDISTLLNLCDIAVASSMREGLPVNIMEAMACGIPIIATKNRGHSELVINHLNGFLVPQNDYLAFSEKIVEMASNPLKSIMGKASRNLMKTYSLDNVSAQLKKIYLTYISEEQNGAEVKYHRSCL